MTLFFRFSRKMPNLPRKSSRLENELRELAESLNEEPELVPVRGRR